MQRFQIEIPDSGYFEGLIACREACPVGTDARAYVQAVAHGDYALAYRIARGPNPFASICGRVCGAPCESACRRGNIDRPVSIRAIKRTATERHGVESGAELDGLLALSTAAGSSAPEHRPERVAVVGAGVAGMTCAHDLARLGYQVTVFEGSKAPGGMLRVGVPGFRLPNGVVQREMDAILRLGVELRCDQSVGVDLTLLQVRAEGFDAVFLGVGLQRARMLELPGAQLQGILPGLDFLRRFNTGVEQPPLGRVVVIGGGDVAYDCARSALRLPGTSSVAMTCLESLAEMPASEIEIIEGEEEGVARHNRRGPVRFMGEGETLTGLETRRVSRVFDERGRFAPELEDGTEEILPADTVILAIGQQSDTRFAAGTPGLELGRGGTVITDPATGATSIPWLFAGGDVANGPGLFIDAISQAQRAARSIHRMLAGAAQAERDLARPTARGFARERVRQGMREDWFELPRRFPPASAPAERVGSADREVEICFDDAEARLQGARCLRCGVETVFDGAACILCGGCADVCPTFCLRLLGLEEIGLALRGPAGGGAIIKDEDRCIRCGLCAHRCPVDAITMERICGHEPWAPLSEATTTLQPEGVTS